MAIKDILLTLESYPDPTPVGAIDRAMSLASRLGAHIAAIACEVHVEIPGSFLSGAGHVGAVVADEAKKSKRSAQDLLSAFETSARKWDLQHETIHDRCLTTDLPNLLVDYARLRDLTIVPVPESPDQWHAEALIFGAGRPVLVLPDTSPSSEVELNRVVVAWDFSRAAARAVADALPLLERAREVRILTVSREKDLASRRSSRDLAQNLARHGIDVVVDNVDAGGQSIGNVLTAQLAAGKADLLVMGAYGHTRFREFVLGGATRSILSRPPVPVLLSH